MISNVDILCLCVWYRNCYLCRPGHQIPILITAVMIILVWLMKLLATIRKWDILRANRLMIWEILLVGKYQIQEVSLEHHYVTEFLLLLDLGCARSTIFCNSIWVHIDTNHVVAKCFLTTSIFRIYSWNSCLF